VECIVRNIVYFVFFHALCFLPSTWLFRMFRWWRVEREIWIAI